jgi:hypothetical protein
MKLSAKRLQRMQLKHHSYANIVKKKAFTLFVTGYFMLKYLLVGHTPQKFCQLIVIILFFILLLPTKNKKGDLHIQKVSFSPNFSKFKYQANIQCVTRSVMEVEQEPAV